MKRKIQALIFRLNPKPEFLVLHVLPRPTTFWQDVTGKVEANESTIEALRREVREETGIGSKDVLEIKQLFAFYYRGRDGASIAEKVFSVKVSSAAKADITKNVYPEHDDYRWLSASKAKNLVKWGSNKRAISKVLKSLKDT